MQSFKYLMVALGVVLAVNVHGSETNSELDSSASVWFKVDEITGDVIVPYIILEESYCPEGDRFFCAALYYTDKAGKPVGELIDVRLKN